MKGRFLLATLDKVPEKREAQRPIDNHKSGHFFLTLDTNYTLKTSKTSKVLFQLLSCPQSSVKKNEPRITHSFQLHSTQLLYTPQWRKDYICQKNIECKEPSNICFQSRSSTTLCQQKSPHMHRPTHWVHVQSGIQLQASF